MNFITSLLFYFYVYDSIYFYEYDELDHLHDCFGRCIDVRHRMHSLHLQNIQVHKINTTSNSQGVINRSRYFYFYYYDDSNNSIQYSIYIIIKLLTKIFFNQPLRAQWCYYNLHILWYANLSICY